MLPALRSFWQLCLNGRFYQAMQGARYAKRMAQFIRAQIF